MERYTRRRALRAGALSASALAAGCLTSSDPGPTDADDGQRASNGTPPNGTMDGAATGNETNADDPDSTANDREEAVVWSREVNLLHVQDGVCYGSEVDQETTMWSVVALDGATGERRWSYDSFGLLTDISTSLVDGGVIVATGGDVPMDSSGRVYALDRDGSERWTAELPEGIYHQPARYGDTIVLVGAAATAYGLDLETGDTVWERSFEASGDDWQFPAIEGIVNGSIVATFHDSTLRGLDPETGLEQWRADGPGEVRSVYVDDAVYVTRNQSFQKLVDGQERWAVPESVAVHGTVGDAILLGWSDTPLTARDRADGRELWSREFAESVAVAVDGESIFVGGTDLHALAADGSTAWSVALDGSEFRSVEAAGEAVYASTERGTHRVGPDRDVTSTTAASTSRRLRVGEYVYVPTSGEVAALDL